MAINDFKPFSTGEEANVLSQSEYEALDAVTNGFQTGIARSEQLNKVWRQASTIASVVARFMADKSGNDVLDDGDLDTLQANLLKALLNNSTAQLDTRYLKNTNNLSDLSNTTQSRTNLGLGKLAVKDSLTATDVGAFPNTGGGLNGEIWSKVSNNYRIISNDMGAFWRFDGASYYLMFTKSGDPNGGWNDLRPLAMSASSGQLTAGHNFRADGAFSCGGNSTTGGTVYAGNGSSWMATDGNIYGSVWGGYLSNYLGANFVRDFRLGSLESTNIAQAIGYLDQPPYVITGVYNFNSDNIIDILYRRPMQKNVNGVWYNVGAA